VILPLSALLIITAFAGLALHQQSMRELAAERDERTAIAAANALNDELRQRLLVVTTMAAGKDSKSSPEDLEASLVSASILIDNKKAVLAFVNHDGIPLTLEPGTSELKAIDWRGLVSKADASSSREARYYLIPGPDQDSTVLAATAPTRDRSLLAVVVFPPSELIQNSLEGLLHSEQGQSIFIVSPERQVLFQKGQADPPVLAASHPGVEEALAGQIGAMHFKTGKEEHIVAYSPVQLTSWALVIEEPWDTIASRMLRTTENAPLVLIPIVVLALLALWFSNRFIIRPLQALETRAMELGRGNFEAIEAPVGGIEEIRTLQLELVNMAAKVRASQKGLHDYISAITHGQEEERRRLARELHDDTLQSLIALNQRLQLVQLKMQGAPQTAEQAETLDQLQQMAQQTIQNLRRMTRGLRPVYLEELGLVAALEMLAKETELGFPIVVDFQRTGSERRLEAEEELALYRIAQEALNNVIKHSEADQARLLLAFSVGLVELEVSDNGKGFDASEDAVISAQNGHLGLLGLHERAEMIGAQIQIHSNPGSGSTLSVILSVKDNSE
jgi:signal transduction histidine kinase